MYFFLLSLIISSFSDFYEEEVPNSIDVLNNGETTFDFYLPAYFVLLLFFYIRFIYICKQVGRR